MVPFVESVGLCLSALEAARLLRRAAQVSLIVVRALAEYVRRVHVNESAACGVLRTTSRRRGIHGNWHDAIKGRNT